MNTYIDHSKLNLPLHPGDTVYSIWDDDGDYRIDEEIVASVVLSQDNTMQFVIDSYVEEFGPKYHLFPTRADAEEQVAKLKASLPRHIKTNVTHTWHNPKIELPDASKDVILTLVTPEDDPGRSISAFFVLEGDCTLPEGFYIISPSAYDENYDIQVDRLNPANTQRIPDERVYAWKAIDLPTTYVSGSLPLE